MISETQSCIIVLQLTDELLAQLQPFKTGLHIAVTAQRLTMRAEIYAALAERVGSVPGYEVRWQPNEFEPDGFVERIRPRNSPIACSHWWATHSMECSSSGLARR